MSAVKSQLKSKEQSWAWSCIWPKQWEHASCGLRSQEARIGSPGRETDTSPSIWTEKISSGELTELLSVDWKDKRNNLQQQPTPVWAVWVTGTERFGGGTLGAWAAGGGGTAELVLVTQRDTIGLVLGVWQVLKPTATVRVKSHCHGDTEWQDQKWTGRNKALLPTWTSPSSAPSW